ncbi:MAG: cupin [Cyanobacteria bacterium P01_A01_bin.45]
MRGQDWLVTEDGNYQSCKSVREWDLLRDNYYLYRFLTELEDTVNSVEEEVARLAKIRMLVRGLLTNSYWVRSKHPQPDMDTGTSVELLYEELGFPFTIQTVTFTPGTLSNIHNHGTWGVVAILKGREKNIIWRRNPTTEFVDNIEKESELILEAGDIISFTGGAIHCVEAVSEEPTVTFNLYGETKSKERFEFDEVNHTAKNF